MKRTVSKQDWLNALGCLGMALMRCAIKPERLTKLTSSAWSRDKKSMPLLGSCIAAILRHEVNAWDRPHLTSALRARIYLEPRSRRIRSWQAPTYSPGTATAGMCWKSSRAFLTAVMCQITSTIWHTPSWCSVEWALRSPSHRLSYCRGTTVTETRSKSCSSPWTKLTR